MKELGTWSGGWLDACQENEMEIRKLTQAELQAKHGTPAEFRAACVRALGEISIDEMNAAVADYEREWREADPAPVRSKRLSPDDTPETVVLKMAHRDTDGLNAGAISVLMSIMANTPRLLPNCDPLTLVSWLDEQGIYANRIWLMHSDICHNNIAETLRLLQACVNGEVDPHALIHAIDNATGLELTLQLRDLPKACKE